MPPVHDLAARPRSESAQWQQMLRDADLNPTVISGPAAIICGFCFAMVAGVLIAQEEFGLLVLLAVWIGATLTIVFVRDYWWSPALIVTALSMRTQAAGFRLTGLEVGMVILGLTFPVKVAMKSLWPVKPKLDPGILYWALLIFLTLHCLVIFFYSGIEGAPQIKNIVKAYYGAIAPLVLYGMLARYCKPQTVFPTVLILFGISLFTALVSIAMILLQVQVNPLTNLKINVDFLDAQGAIALLRSLGPSLFISAIVFWPVARSHAVRLLLVFAGLVGIAGAVCSAGRVAVLTCGVVAIVFAVVRGRFWLALPAIGAAALLAGVISMNPNLLDYLPEQAQRALAPLNVSDQKTAIQETLTGSDLWHQELRDDSLVYWMSDTNSLFLGHGFKSWDDSLNDEETPDFEVHKQFAIEMGLTENMFSAITNIFGLTGLVLYSAFLLHLAWRLWKGQRASPERSKERALCEFSLVNLVSCVALAPFVGGIPGIVLISWQLGLLAARPYLGEPEAKAPVAIRPSFDRSREIPLLKDARLARQGTGGRVRSGLSRARH